ncbi:MAG: hypothetical protein H6666_06780 [Ardenticatenaceae bacterium]|nr:hypothetical protein [Anaerolineales bacterium]MCB8917610.1 hypothetical protein [Ardenticatenaceae bacterium]
MSTLHNRTLPNNLIFSFSLLLLMLLTACGGATATAVPVPTFIPTLTPTSAIPTVTPTPPAVTPTPEPNAVFEGIQFTYGISLTQSLTFTRKPAVPPTENTPFWEVVPELVEVTFSGYIHSESAYQPGIFFYPVAEFGPDPQYGQVFINTQQLLQARPVYVPEGIPILPARPPFNNAAPQILQAHLQYLTFANGSGVRFLTQYSQVAELVNNFKLLYVFQGLTNDGRTYIAAVFPVASAILPASGEFVAADMEEFVASYPTYLDITRQQLNAQPVFNFTPSLADLDALFRSMRVNE